MSTSQIIERIKSVEPALRAQGIAALYLFGSFAHAEGSPQSDIDVFVDRENRYALGFDEYMNAVDILEQASGRRIDFGTREGLKRAYRETTEREAVRVF